MRSTRRAWGVRQPSCRKAVWTKLRETGFRPPAVLWLTSRCGLAVVGQRVHRTSSHARIGPPTWPPGWPSTRVGRVPACCRSFSKPASAGPWPVPGPVPGRGSGPSSGKVAPRGAARCAGYNPGPLTRGGPPDGHHQCERRCPGSGDPRLARRAALRAWPAAALPDLRAADQPARRPRPPLRQDLHRAGDRGPGPRVRPNPHRGSGRRFDGLPDGGEPVIRIADFGDRLEAYDRLPTERGARRLAVARRAERGDDWRGWRIEGTDAVKVVATKAQARQWLDLFADRALAEAGPEFFTAQLTRLAGAIGRRDGAAVLAVLEYLAAEGDRQVADALFDHMTTAGLFAVTKPEAKARR